MYFAADARALNFLWTATLHRCSEPVADRTIGRSVFGQVKLAAPFRAALLTGRELLFDFREQNPRTH